MRDRFRDTMRGAYAMTIVRLSVLNLGPTDVILWCLHIVIWVLCETIYQKDFPTHRMLRIRACRSFALALQKTRLEVGVEGGDILVMCPRQIAGDHHKVLYKCAWTILPGSEIELIQQEKISSQRLISDGGFVRSRRDQTSGQAQESSRSAVTSQVTQPL